MKPVLQALLVADHVYTDATTQKKIVVGIFHRIWFRCPIPQPVPGEGAEQVVVIVPAGGQQAGSPFCYISLADVHGDQRFELRYVDLSDDRVLFGAKFAVDWRDPLQTCEIVLPLPVLPAGKAGTFALELLWNDEPLGSHRIVVEEIDEEKGKEHGN